MRTSTSTGSIWRRNTDERVLFDTNVVLDVLLDRQPYVEASASAWAAVETGASEGMLAAHALTTIYYLVRKERGDAQARRIVSAILRVFKSSRRG